MPNKNISKKGTIPKKESRSKKEKNREKNKLLKIGDAKRVCEDTIIKLRPSSSERKEVNKRISGFVARLNNGLKKYKAKAVLGGSGAKGTWLSGSFDADIFVLFDYKTYSAYSEKQDKEQNSNRISEILGIVLKKTFKSVKTLHGSRDYFQITDRITDKPCNNKKRGSTSGKKTSQKKSTKEFIFEIVPILEIKKAEQAKNITDISPLHTKWVVWQIKNKAKKKKKTKNKKSEKKERAKKQKTRFASLTDQILLTKAFSKAQGAYGAESYINGFSGYACEVLTAHYGSFLELATNAAEGWFREQNEKVIIDPEGHWKTKNASLELNSSKITGPLILVDPVQATRNVTAALSQEKFELFRDRCHEFLRNPTEEFFTRKTMELHEIKELLRLYPKERIVIAEITANPGREDSVGCSLLKIFNQITSELGKEGFSLLHKDWDFDKKTKVRMWFIVNKEELKKMKIHEGPPLSMPNAVKEFKKKHNITFEQNGKICAEVERKFTKAEGLIKDILDKNSGRDGRDKRIKSWKMTE